MYWDNHDKNSRKFKFITPWKICRILTMNISMSPSPLFWKVIHRYDKNFRRTPILYSACTSYVPFKIIKVPLGACVHVD